MRGENESINCGQKSELDNGNSSGALYGYESIPEEWKRDIIKKNI